MADPPASRLRFSARVRASTGFILIRRRFICTVTGIGGSPFPWAAYPEQFPWIPDGLPTLSPPCRSFTAWAQSDHGDYSKGLRLFRFDALAAPFIPNGPVYPARGHPNFGILKAFLRFQFIRRISKSRRVLYWMVLQHHFESSQFVDDLLMR